MIEQANSHQLKTLLSDSDLPILLVFYTASCGFSRLMNSRFEEINNQMKQQLKIVKVDSEAYPDLANEYKIHALPTMLLFNKGKLIDRIETESSEKLMSVDFLMKRLKSLV